MSTMLIVTPWLHGAELLWEQMLTAALIFLSFSLLLLSQSRDRVRHSSIRYIVIPGIIWICYHMLYLLPMPLSLLKLLSPSAFSWYTHPLMSESPALSLYRFATLTEVIKFAALVALVPLVYRLCQFRQTAETLIAVMVIIAAITSVYSLLNFATAGRFDIIPAIPPWDYPWREGIRGTYSYKNQYATYLAMSVALGTGWSMSIYQSIRLRSGIATNWLFSRSFLKLAIVVLLTGLTYITLLNTASRGAVLSLTLSVLLVFGSYVLLQADRRQALMRPRALIAGSLVLIVGSLLFVQSSAFERFTQYEFEDNGRQQLRETAIHVFADFPLTGTGAGTYPYVQHNYKPASLGNSGMSQRAHNDYLETLATQGIIGAGLTALFICALLSGVFKRSNADVSPFLLACRSGVLTLLIQSAIDVNLSTFWLPVYFIIICVLGWHFREASHVNRVQKETGTI
ncbi:O-antigen ligase family protein [Alteromonas sp. H39]|uniref:O-antigen ligase family protein n=1 Tax=Alteromonas sp. H39 TaxID=3389876 RepID=UPI0039DF94D7